MRKHGSQRVRHHYNPAFIQTQLNLKKKFFIKVIFLSFDHPLDIEVMILILGGRSDISVLMSNCHIPCF